MSSSARAPVAAALADFASCVISAHRCCKQILTAVSSHVRTASKTPSQGHLCREKPQPAESSPAPVRTDALTGETSPGEPEKTLALFISKDTKTP